MQVILNYKSYYDAFKLGMVNNGFKPVAEVLFYPLFHSHTLCDGNGTPYEVDAGNASHWGNGQDLIPKEIQDAVGTKDQGGRTIMYFIKNTKLLSGIDTLSVLELNPGLNIIYGSSNTGKSVGVKLFSMFGN